MTQNNEKQEWLNIKEAAEYCRVSDSWLRIQIRQGRLKFTRSGGNTGKIILKREWLDVLLLEGVTNG